MGGLCDNFLGVGVTIQEKCPLACDECEGGPVETTPRVCCEALTLDCIACQQGMTPDEFCNENPTDHFCQPPITTCPESTPDFGSRCDLAGLRCEYGEECCCGRCSPSIIMECDGQSFTGFFTDACMVPNCPEPECPIEVPTGSCEGFEDMTCEYDFVPCCEDSLPT